MKDERSFYDRFWWIPHIVSSISLIASIVALVLTR